MRGAPPRTLPGVFRPRRRKNFSQIDLASFEISPGETAKPAGAEPPDAISHMLCAQGVCTRMRRMRATDLRSKRRTHSVGWAFSPPSARDRGRDLGRVGRPADIGRPGREPPVRSATVFLATKRPSSAEFRHLSEAFRSRPGVILTCFKPEPRLIKQTESQDKMPFSTFPAHNFGAPLPRQSGRAARNGEV